MLLESLRLPVEENEIILGVYYSGLLSGYYVANNGILRYINFFEEADIVEFDLNVPFEDNEMINSYQRSRTSCNENIIRMIKLSGMKATPCDDML